MSETNYFEELYKVNCNDKTEKKNGLTYLSWAFAWAEIKKRHPDAFYTIYENDKGWFYHTDEKTCWVKTGVTVAGLEHIEYLPVMDFRNQSIPADKVTSFDVNKTIQRSLTKACARHGLGLYVYSGEDLPEQPFNPMTKEQREHLEKLGANWDTLLPYLKVGSIDEISKEMAESLIKAKEAKMQETL